VCPNRVEGLQPPFGGRPNARGVGSKAAKLGLCIKNDAEAEDLAPNLIRPWCRSTRLIMSHRG
jgi:hypothetical protein